MTIKKSYNNEDEVLSILVRVIGSYGTAARAIILFDLDSTLVINPLSRKVMPKIYEEVSEALGISIDRVAELFTKKHMERVRVGDPRAYDWDDILIEILREHGARPWSNNAFLEKLREECSSVETLDDSPKVLERLERLGFYLVLSTNGLWKYQECVVREAGLARYFREILSPDKKGCLKSSKRFFVTMLENPIKISVGDNIVFDVYYPKIYGLRAIHVKRSLSIGDEYARALGIDLSSIKPDATITSLTQLYNVLESVLEGSYEERRL